MVGVATIVASGMQWFSGTVHLLPAAHPQCVWSSFERLVKIKEMVLEEKLFDPEQGNFEMSMGSLCLVFTCRVTQ